MFPTVIKLNVATFNDRIMGMMEDHNISMSEALLWDFEGFTFTASHIYAKYGIRGLENRFRTYLIRKCVSGKDSDFYTNIFLGRDYDRKLKKDDDDAKGENEQSGQNPGSEA